MRPRSNRAPGTDSAAPGFVDNFGVVAVDRLTSGADRLSSMMLCRGPVPAHLRRGFTEAVRA
jgi:hypothetical protein